MGGTLEDMEETVLMEDLVLLALCLDLVSMDSKEEIITREGLLVGTVMEAASVVDQDHQISGGSSVSKGGHGGAGYGIVKFG